MKYADIIDNYRSQGVSEIYLKEIDKIRENSEISPNVVVPDTVFIGKSVLEKAIVSLLNGNNIILVGNKASGKNVLADNMAFVFGREPFTMSFNSEMGAKDLIGEFFNDGKEFRDGPIAKCAKLGGFGILDEINMATPGSTAILHSLLDYRRIVDLPGMNKFKVHDSARFIGTMNYGYLGTKELNEALVSRFQVIVIGESTKEQISTILLNRFNDLEIEHANTIALMFCRIQEMARVAELPSKVVDLRGIIDAIKTIRSGLNPYEALLMGVAYKAFNDSDVDLVSSLIRDYYSPNKEYKLFKGGN